MAEIDPSRRRLDDELLGSHHQGVERKIRNPMTIHYLSQCDLADLRQLGLSEPDERVARLVPESVALAQVPELDADDAGEGGAHQAAVQRRLRQTACRGPSIYDVRSGRGERERAPRN